MHLETLQIPRDTSRVLPLLRELRPELNEALFLERYEAARQSDQFRLIGLVERPGSTSEPLVALMGCRVLTDFLHGRHLYVDDLVTSPAERSRGRGAELLRHAETLAQELGCRGLRLCTGTANEAGKRFYEREGWSCRSVAYKKGF